jgi:acyl-CoA thioester hydrolase
MRERPASHETFRGVVFPWHCDVMGHFSVQHQMPLLDGAIYHLLGLLGPLVAEQDGHRIGWADVRHEITYQREMKAGDLLVCESSIVAVGNSSIRHRTVLVRLPDRQACTILEGVTVRFDLHERKSVLLAGSERELATGLLVTAA